MPKTTNPKNNQRGFSLIELIVTVSVMLVALGAVLSLLTRGQAVATNEREMLDTMQNVRGAFDMLTREIRLAGAGLPGGIYSPTGYGITSATDDSVTLIGNFKNISSIAIAVDSGGKKITVGSVEGFAAGQTVALINADGSQGLFTKIESVDAPARQLRVTAETTTLLSGSTLNNIKPGAAVEVIEMVTYSITAGQINRRVRPYLTPTAGTEEILAENILDEAGNNGLSFVYYDSDSYQLTEPIDPAHITHVHTNLNARTRTTDDLTGEYRTLQLAMAIRPRNQ